MSVRILVGHVLDKLAELPDGSVQCVVTSPPYWQQRDYGVEGQIGLEPRPEEYIAKLVEVFAEVRRILRDDGTCWINIGDKWASGGKGGGGSFMEGRAEAWAHARNRKGWRSPPDGYKDKDLVGIPFMLAFAMRANGWYWRQCNIWAKPNGMPESVTDRSTIAHEYVLHFSKSNDYWYDDEAARTPAAPATELRLAQNIESQLGSLRANGGSKTNGRMKTVSRRRRGWTPRHQPYALSCDQSGLDTVGRGDGANIRSVWWISPAQAQGDHHAVMPDKLAAICILSGCPVGGVVLDPFLGSGTTAIVADALARDCIGIELNPKFARQARHRCRSPGFALMAAD